MDGESLSFPINLEIPSKNGRLKNVKRKHTSVVNESHGIYPKVKKRKLSKPSDCSDYSKHDLVKHVQYEKTNHYFRVVANPERALPPPQIFHVNQFKDNTPSDHFLLKFLSAKTFNTDVSLRFRQENVHCNAQDDNKKGEKKKKNKHRSNKENDMEKAEEEPEAGAREEVIAPEPNRGLRVDEVEETNPVDTYRVVQGKGLIFHMSHPSKFSFNGEIRATIIKGDIEILGYTLSEGSCRSSVEVYSPNFCTPLIIETKASSRLNQFAEDVQVRLKALLTEDDLDTLSSKLKPNDSLLLIEQITSDLGRVLNKYFDKALFPKDLEDVSSRTETMETLQSIFAFKLSEQGKHFRKNPQWDKIPLGQCTVLCGGKGVGKSMLLKYYTNRLLSVGEKVLVLDLDPGQPEFTFPGCISAVMAEEPLIGPNFTHVTEPAIMTCFGEVEVARNPTKYLECVRFVVEGCKKNEEFLKMKWMVNTMGFCKGLGVDLMISVLKLLNPNTVVQIKGSDFKNNYPFFLTPATVNGKAGFRSMALENVSLSYDLRVVFSSAELEGKPLQGGLRRRQLRDIMSISYFSRMVSPPFYNFNAVQPYLISFSKVYLGVEFLADPNDVAKAFNGNTVFLSHFEPNDEEILSVSSGENEYFRIVVKPRLGPSLGAGFVRGIDCANKKFYVLTHLAKEVLDEVNCLTLGRVGPPHCMFLRQEAVESKIVYATTCTGDIIRSVKRMFRVPGTLVEKEKMAPKF